MRQIMYASNTLCFSFVILETNDLWNYLFNVFLPYWTMISIRAEIWSIMCLPLNPPSLGYCIVCNRSSINTCWISFFHWPHRLADLLEENQEELATIEALDSGAVYTLALKTHIGMSVQTFRYFAGWCDKIQVSTNTICSEKKGFNID